MICGRLLPGIAVSNPPEGMVVCLLWVLCVFMCRSLRQDDHSSRGVLPLVACLSVIVKPRHRGILSIIITRSGSLLKLLDFPMRSSVVSLFVPQLVNYTLFFNVFICSFLGEVAEAWRAYRLWTISLFRMPKPLPPCDLHELSVWC